MADKEITDFQTAYNVYLTGNCTVSSTSSACISKGNTLSTTYGNLITYYDGPDYTKKYSDFNNYYLNNKKLQNELHAKMKELNKTPDSLYAEHQSTYDSAIYMNIIATVLATSLLYFTFVKLE
jgi:hypothetical protein